LIVPFPFSPSSFSFRSTMIQRPENLYDRYHAHVYFGHGTVEQARALCEKAGALFGVAVGRVHEREVGPHPHWSCQLAFDRAAFDSVIPWLEEHRDGLDVFVHGLTGDDLADHTTHASWLGEPWELKLEMFRR
jgi:DOPA 4,5-dioxygenase